MKKNGEKSGAHDNSNDNELYNFSETLFYFSTQLNKNNFEKFIDDIKDKKQTDLFEFRIKILSSMYSYLIVFMNRFLDTFYNGIIFHLLVMFEKFSKNYFIDILRKYFNNKDLDEIKELMIEDITSLSERRMLESNYKVYTDAYEHLNTLNRLV